MSKAVATNRKARRDYEIEEVYEAGMALTGTEVKSLRENGASLKEGFALVQDGEVYLYDVHIPPYKKGNVANHDPTRERKLLLNRREIDRIRGRVTQKGYALVPLRIYFKRGYAKVELGLGKGRKKYDKREKLKKKDQERRIQRELKDFERGRY